VAASGVFVLLAAVCVLTTAGSAGGAAPARRAGALAAGAPRVAAPRISKPPITQNPIVFGAKRKAETAAYCKRHYGSDTYLLTPKVIVLHFTGGSTWQSAWSYFSQDVPDPEFHELPGPVAHFIIDQKGVIHQTISLKYRGRHTYGLNYVAIGIEFVQALPAGKSASWADQQILGRPAQINAGLRLVKWLQATYHIKLSNIIGHSMARSSPYYKDLVRHNVPDHSDWQKADVLVFRSRLGSVQ
jgi:N-acetyl-anhydromuramyl-L-alanine amidase AmpD